ncbi:acetyltransferase [candidate division WOR-1 bacterium RIFOXYA12_FULL_43_27]|uniref:Acetyltransferase n=1 Tax=candidate division WOR-1 bacterium RIFOXYC2_FULL_46_14 TaxID=1802587 RepID=A0A1F4U3Q8_UNCSA|nr:MAG: acetyltransferase [candidate division WOR-1 bacterium RIFOXYA12_FULL_43_27]OGC20925.1 MAG: acetyltransferase [candidate division WOR-1 bacterium RIFOXYB2_FULL_46_45]OGC32316.1 MAG: acetyltransferase [candidate division WOR-1 bacterium RIFOXYA2_FULL_46_56]OGC39615.1 MAG: acetyltransferase [candidate division WOR-1 bacterium RIFOXYC2_FULL_46_14]
MNKYEDVFIHPSAEIKPGARIGRGSMIWNQAQIRESAVIGKKCIIGKSVYIDQGVKIGDRVKVQNGVSVYCGVELEDDVFLGPFSTLTNDLYPRAFDPDWQIYKTLIKKGASIGANATVVCGNTIGEYAMIGAGTVVVSDVPPHGLVLGNPGKLFGFVCICGRKLSSLIEENEQAKVFKCDHCAKHISIPKENMQLSKSLKRKHLSLEGDNL